MTSSWAIQTSLLRTSELSICKWYKFLGEIFSNSYVLCLLNGESNGTPFQYSCLENPMGRGAWWAAVQGVAKSRTQLSDFTFTFHFHALEKEMATRSSVLAWRIPGTGEPGGLLSIRSHRVGHDWSDLAAAAAAGKKLIPLKVWEGWGDAFREEIKVSVQKGYHKCLVKHISLSLPSCENVTSKVQNIFWRKGRPAGLNTALESHEESHGLGVPDGRVTLWQ